MSEGEESDSCFKQSAAESAVLVVVTRTHKHMQNVWDIIAWGGVYDEEDGQTLFKQFGLKKNWGTLKLHSHADEQNDNMILFYTFVLGVNIK